MKIGKIKLKRKQNKTKNRAKKKIKLKVNFKINRKKFGLVVLGFIIVVSSIWVIRWILDKEDYRTSFVRNGKIEEIIKGEAVFIRQEEVINSKTNGKIIKDVDDGERVAVDKRIASILDNEAEKIYNELLKIQEEIVLLQREKIKTQNSHPEELLGVDEKIYNTLKTVSIESNVNSLDKLKKYDNSLVNLLKQRTDIISRISTGDVLIAAKIKDKDRISNQLKQLTKEIRSNSSGIISFNIDGYEEKLNFENLNIIDSDLINSISSKNSFVNEFVSTVEKDRPIAKIVKENEYYSVLALPNEKVQDLNFGTKVQVRINEINKSISGIVMQKIADKHGQIILQIKLDKYINDTLNLRKTNVELVKKSEEGLMVPIKSVASFEENDTVAKLAIVKNGYVYFENVKVKEKNDENLIFEPKIQVFKQNVSLYDVYIINPTNKLKEGQKVTNE